MIQAVSPVDCLRRRFEAHRCGDYAAIYGSFHPQAPFLLHFPDLATYETFAREQLSSIQMLSWRCTMDRSLDAGQVECIQIVEFEHEGMISCIIELALLIDVGQGWRYHSAQKLNAQDLSVSAELVDFSHFDEAADRVRF